MTARSDIWWEHRSLADPPDSRHGATAHRRAVCLRDGQAVGYALYRWTDVTDESACVSIVELIAEDALAERQLWQYLFGTDLVTSFHYWNLPVDDSLNWWLDQPRRAKRVVEDGLWLRLLDVPAALSRRRYATPGEIKIGVKDSICSWNNASWNLQVSEDGSAICSATESTADIQLGVDVLGAAYLGGRRLVDLARAGLVEGNEKRIRAADTIFSWHRQPWIQEVF